jgi:CPA2 family monovalent cation:H+ antiporter-2
LLPFGLSSSFIHIGAEIGVLLLLFMLGLEYTGEQLRESLQVGVLSGLIDLILNFLPGFGAGLLLGWSPLAAALMGGVTWISSSGIIAKIIDDTGRAGNPETRTILTVLVLEDLAMAIYLPIIDAFIQRGGPLRTFLSIALALAAVSIVLIVAIRYGRRISNAIEHESDEVVLLTTFGIVLLVAGLARTVQMSSGVGAFLVGVALSGPMAKRSHRLIAPLRDLFAATFFFFFGLEIDPGTLPGVAVPAAALGVITGLTKIATGYLAAKRAGMDSKAAKRAGVTLIARGEFSIVVAGLGASLEPALGPVAAAYVLLLAIAGPALTRRLK